MRWKLTSLTMMPNDAEKLISVLYLGDDLQADNDWLCSFSYAQCRVIRHQNRILKQHAYRGNGKLQ